jgi:hypothetical protein
VILAIRSFAEMLDGRRENEPVKKSLLAKTKVPSDFLTDFGGISASESGGR